MRLCKTKAPCESHSVELILAQWFEKVMALYLVIGQSQDKKLARSLCQDAFSQIHYYFFFFALVDFGLPPLTPKKWVSNGVEIFNKYFLESWRIWLYVGAVWFVVFQQVVFGI